MASQFNKTVQQAMGILSLGTSLLGGGNTVPKVGVGNTGQEVYAKKTEEVRSGIRKYGIQKSSMAFVTVDLPPFLRNGINSSFGGGGFNESLGLLASNRAESFSQPGVAFATSDIRRYGIGPIERKPYVPIFLDYNINFIGDSDGVIHKFFYFWLNSIINYTSLPSGDGEKDIFQKGPYEVEYKDNYKTDISIYTFNEVQQKAGIIILYNAHPFSMGEIGRNWADENTLVRIPVQFTYSHWAYNEVDLTLRSQRTNNRTIGLFEKVYKAASIIQSVSSIKRPQNINDIVNVVNSGRTTIGSISGSNINF
jgi:hypothetical protein